VGEDFTRALPIVPEDPVVEADAIPDPHIGEDGAVPQRIEIEGRAVPRIKNSMVLSIPFVVSVSSPPLILPLS
jgi:hypothetical protein